MYLSAGLAVIMAFNGVKLILHWGHGLSHQVPEMSAAVSLTVIAAVLTVTTVASLVRSRRHPAVRAHAGAVIGTPPRTKRRRARPTRQRAGPCGPRPAARVILAACPDRRCPAARTGQCPATATIAA
jgi:tellurite resistance protein TerC